MQHILAWCSARGLRRVYGDVLAENAAMLGLARKLGFDERPMADTSGVIRVELDLRV
jgi:acetyltransferase